MPRTWDVRVRRIYDQAEPGDGARVLIDGMWPRGVRKDDLDHDEWVKDIAPSSELRTWFGHEPDRFDRFTTRYQEELEAGPGREALDHLRALTKDGTVTLLTATKDLRHSHAAVVADLLNGRPGRRSS